MKEVNKKITKKIGLLLLMAVLISVASILPLAEWASGAHGWAAQHSVAAPLIYIAVICVATVLFLPGSVAIMISGYLFGFLPGLLIAVIATPLASQCAFAAGRWAVGEWVRDRVKQRPDLRAVGAGLQNEAFLIIVLTRLSLIIPFNVLNYIYGASAVRATTHFLATIVGMLPAVALYVYVGTLAHNVGQILSGDAAPAELGYWILPIGLLVIAFTSWVIHRAASRALARHVDNFEHDLHPEVETSR